MTAMILAAGRGERMRPLTDALPKPLLKVKNKALIIYHIENLAKNGFKEIVINIAHLGFMIPNFLGDGSKWGVKLIYSDEQKEGGLETAGGIIKALPLINSETFLVINADIWCNYRFNINFNLRDDMAHLILVPNPQHNIDGDFSLVDGIVKNDGANKYTFSGIAYYNRDFFTNLKYGRRSLAPLIRDRLKHNRVRASLYDGIWYDIGTPKRLKDVHKIVTDLTL